MEKETNIREDKTADREKEANVWENEAAEEVVADVLKEEADAQVDNS